MMSTITGGRLNCVVLLVSFVQEQHLGRNCRQLEIVYQAIRRMNVAMYQNRVYTHNINKLLARMMSNTVDAWFETEYTSQRIWYIKTNFTLCSNHSQYALQRVDIRKNCNVTVSTYTSNFSIYSL